MSVSDDFNRANSSSLGANWMNFPASPSMQIVSNTARGTDEGTYQWAAYSAVSWNSNQSSQVDVTDIETLTDTGVILHASAGIDGYMFMYHATLGMRIYRRDDDSFTLLNDIGGSAVTPFVAKADRSGGTLTLYKDGVSQGTASDSAYTGGLPGIYSANGDATNALDDWVGTGEASGPVLTSGYIAPFGWR